MPKFQLSTKRPDSHILDKFNISETWVSRRDRCLSELTAAAQCHRAHPSDVVLQASDAERADDKPELEGAKPLAQWDLPVLQAVCTRVVNRWHQ